MCEDISIENTGNTTLDINFFSKTAIKALKQRVKFFQI